MFNIPDYKPQWYLTLDELLHDQQLMQRLSTLRHQTIQESIIMWDLLHDEHNTSAPVILQLDDNQLEISCYKMEHIAITLDQIDRKIPLEILELGEYGTYTYEWRKHPSFHKHLAYAVIQGLSIEEYTFETNVLDDREHPERIGDMYSDLLLNGVYIETDKGDFSVYNGLDETQILFGESLEKEMIQIGEKIKRTRIF